jgi:hypothetical protein
VGTCPLHRGESQPEKPERQCHVHLPEDVVRRWEAAVPASLSAGEPGESIA